MKKTLVSALTTAMVVGAASTTFAAANPFADVPADHWAYDAVSQLAADGVIEGYGDGTYRGDRSITRYEMAQMVAKAMAKNPSGADKALVDKLAAEFADELNNLGVRVANLERNADMVKWTGKAEFTVQQTNKDAAAERDRYTQAVFRLEPTAEVNSHWQVKARVDGKIHLDNDDTNDVELKRVWAQGNYDNFTVKAGKFANTIANDIIFDDPFSGASVEFGNQLKVTLAGGRIANGTLNNYNNDNNQDVKTWGTSRANYIGLGLNYGVDKFTARAGYQRLSSVAVQGEDKVNIWSVGANYAFDKNVNLDATYGRSNLENQNSAYSYEVNYKGAEAENQGTWGAWLGYRSLGNGVAFDPTYDVVKTGYKGWELGAKYTLWKNIVAQAQYGRGSNIDTGNNYNSVFGRVEFFF